MPSFFSQRNAPPPSQLSYDVPETMRSRILAILDHHIGNERSMQAFLAEMEDLLCRQYGQLRASSYRAARRSDIPVVEHFYCCPDEQALDFIEACFQLSVQCGGQKAVDEINAVFRQEGVGYELTKFLGPATPKGSVILGKQIAPDQLPRVVRVDEQTAHTEIVAPALSLLTTPVLAIANAEMLKAFSDHRAGRHEDAITACGSAFESVLKTICDQKGWAYDRDKDTFVVTFLFHHFLSPEDVKWLGNFADLELSEDEQRALVFVREVGAINNSAYRDLNRVEIRRAARQQAKRSQILRRNSFVPFRQLQLKRFRILHTPPTTHEVRVVDRHGPPLRNLQE